MVFHDGFDIELWARIGALKGPRSEPVSAGGSVDLKPGGVRGCPIVPPGVTFGETLHLFVTSFKFE